MAWSEREETLLLLDGNEVLAFHVKTQKLTKKTMPSPPTASERELTFGFFSILTFYKIVCCGQNGSLVTSSGKGEVMIFDSINSEEASRQFTLTLPEYIGDEELAEIKSVAQINSRYIIYLWTWKEDNGDIISSPFLIDLEDDSTDDFDQEIEQAEGEMASLTNMTSVTFNTRFFF